MKNYRIRATALLGILMFASVACNKDDENEAVDYRQRDDQMIQDYLADQNIDDAIKDESGLYYRIRTQGTGIAPTEIDTVVVAYIGRLITRNDSTEVVSLSEKPFDFTPSAEPPRKFLLKNLVEGWKIGLPKISAGGSIDLYIPSHLGYGNKYQSNIPTNSVLYFDIDLLNVIPDTDN